MSIYSNIKNIFQSTAKAVGDIFDNQTWSPFSLRRSGSNSKTLMQSNKGWVYVCVDIIASSLSGIELKLMRQTDGDKADEQLFSHPILDRLQRPNTFLDGRELMYHLFGHTELLGNAYWEKHEDGSLIPIPPTNVTVKIAADGFSIEGYEVRTNKGGKKFIMPEDMYHYRYPNLKNPFVGTGVAENISDWIDVEAFATEFNRSFFEQGGTVGDVLETQATTKQEIDIIRKGWEMKHRGMRNAHNAAILPNGTKLTKGGTTLRDMQFSELDTRYRDKILAAFGVPKSILGITESGMSRADAEAKNYSFAFFTLEPKFRRFIEWLNNTVVRDLDDTGRLYLDFDSIIPEDKSHELETIKAGTSNSAFMTINEARERAGLAPVEDGDEIPQSSPFGMLSLGKTKEGTKQKKKRIVPTSVSAKDSMADDILSKFNNASFTIKGFTEAEDKAHQKAWEKRVVRAEPYEEMIADATREFNASQKRRARKWVRENVSTDKALTKGKMDILDKTEEMGIMIEFMSPVLNDLLQKEGDATMMTVNPVAKFDINNDVVKERFDKYIGRTAESYSDTTVAALEDTILEGIEEGENVNQIEARVNEVYEYSDTVRAELMAKTVTFEVSNEATQGAFEQSGVVKTKKWFTAQDERVCPMCYPMHGKEVSVTTTFYKEGESIVGSNSATAFMDMPHPPLHPRCRCTIVAGEIDYGRGHTSATEKEILSDMLDSMT